MAELFWEGERMCRANDRGPAWFWTALLLACAAVASGGGCGAPSEPREAIDIPTRSPAIACPVDPKTNLATTNCDGGVEDAGPDGGEDGGPDAGPPDGGPDAGPDGGSDGGPPDGGSDGGPDGGICDPSVVQAALLRGEAVDPNACKWNIPPNTREILPLNIIVDTGPVNVVGKLQATKTNTYDKCLSDAKTTGTANIQACVRYAANVAGWCFAGSYGDSQEDGQCSTPFCACEGAPGECREPSCTLHKDNTQFGGGGGFNVSANVGLKKLLPPAAAAYIPSAFVLNGNFIAQIGGGYGNDDREGSGSCFSCCANGNPFADDVKHFNAEIKATFFLTARFWNLCFTATFSAGYCYQHDFINRLQCDGTKTFENNNLNYLFLNLGNGYFGYCTGSGDNKENGRGGACAFDTTTHELRCGFGWLKAGWKLPADWQRGNGTSENCLF